jgi:hypothetical protein
MSSINMPAYPSIRRLLIFSEENKRINTISKRVNDAKYTSHDWHILSKIYG